MSRYAQSIAKQRQQAAPVVRRKVAAMAPAFPSAGARTAHLQRTVGNQALGRLAIQAKLTLGPVNDPYEQEADAVAKQVVQHMRTPSAGAGAAPAVQRQGSNSMEELDENALPRKPVADLVQRLTGQETEEDELQTPVMAKSLVQRTATGEPDSVNPTIESSIQRARGNGQALGEGVRAPLESAFGADFSLVNIHTSHEADALNQSLQARAFTTGQDIFFRQGEYNPGTAAGQELLAHELTHVVQQNGDTVKKKCDACEAEDARHDSTLS